MKRCNELIDVYSTHDLGEATYISIFHPLAGTTRNDAGRVSFLFEDGEGIRILAADYYANRGVVAPMRYMLALRGMKSTIHSTDRRGGSSAPDVVRG